MTALILSGCAVSGSSQPHQGLTEHVTPQTEAWQYDGVAGHQLRTPHYLIHTTIDDAEIVDGLVQVMEGAYAQYRALAPEAAPTDKPMDCYLFGFREHWAGFTQAHTGDDAPLYLGIARGGYTVGDVYASYFIGDTATYCVAAHEGWHQFVSRHFAQRVPPFLEEGLACLFESVNWDTRLPSWDFARNHNRLRGLREAIEEDRMMPLAQLAAMHAGQIVNQPFARVEGFYAQCWAFARFLYDGEEGRHRAALLQMLADAAAGRLYPRSATQPAASTKWNPALVRPILERYLREDLDVIDGRYRQYAKRIAMAGYHSSRLRFSGGF